MSPLSEVHVKVLATDDGVYIKSKKAITPNGNFQLSILVDFDFDIMHT